MRESTPPPPSLRGAPPPSETLLGQLVGGRFELLREMGRGGIASVFLARHKFTARALAVKVLLPEYQRHPEARERLLREARMLGRIVHPNVVEIIDAGIADDTPYVAMERLRAKSVDALLAARSKLTVHDTFTIATLASEALAAVHAARVVHRDIKPSNLLVVRNAQGGRSLKLIDFGAATFAQDEVGEEPASGIIGTPEYMAPEQLAGARVAPSADVYAFGITLFECLAGRVPFSGTLESIYDKARRGDRPELRKSRPDVPAAFAALVERAISPDPSARFADAAALREELARIEPDIRADVTEVSPSRRGHVRVAYNAPIEMQLNSGRVVEGRVQDVSTGGIYVTTSAPVREGESLVLRFALPTGEIVRSVALVRWAKAAEDAQRVALGLEFTDLSTIFREAIEDYIKRAST